MPNSNTEQLYNVKNKTGGSIPKKLNFQISPHILKKYSKKHCFYKVRANYYIKN